MITATNERSVHPRVLAMDLGHKQYGVAAYLDGEIISRHDNPGMTIEFYQHAINTIKQARIDAVVYENAFHQQGEAARHWHDYRVALEMACQATNTVVYFVPVGTWKVNLLGKGGAKAKKPKLKLDPPYPVIAAVNQRFGKNVTDDNEADALGVLAWFIDNQKRLMENGVVEKV